MKITFPVVALGILISSLNAADHVVAYRAFGPQVIAHEAIGMEWWQWDSHGDSRPRGYPIKVVIYWGQPLDATKAKYPVDREKENDFRYIEYSAAVAHMEKAVRELRRAKLDSSEIEKELKALQAIHAKSEQGD